MSIARTFTVLISVYLLSNTLNGIFLKADINSSGNYKSIITVSVLLMIFITLWIRRLKISGLDDLRLVDHYELESEWTTEKKNKSNLKKGIIASLPFIYLVIKDPAVVAIPVACGFISALIVSAIWGNIFLRSDLLEDIESKKAKIVVICPGCILIFVVLFTKLTILL